MANQNYTILLVFAALAIAIVIAVVVSQKESFTTNYLKNIAVGNEPATNQVFSMPSYYASLDPRSENQGVSGLRGGGSAPREMMPFSTSGGSMYTAEEMINMGGCADMCDESCPKSSTGYAYLSKDSYDKNNLRTYLSSLSEEDRQNIINKIDNSLPENERMNFSKVESPKKASYQFQEPWEPAWMKYASKFNPTRDQWECMHSWNAWQGDVGISQVDECLGRGGPSWWQKAWDWLMNHPSEYIPPSRGGGSYRATPGNQNSTESNLRTYLSSLSEEERQNVINKIDSSLPENERMNFSKVESPKKASYQFQEPWEPAWMKYASKFNPTRDQWECMHSWNAWQGDVGISQVDECLGRGGPSWWQKAWDWLMNHPSEYIPPSRGGGSYRAAPGNQNKMNEWNSLSKPEKKSLVDTFMNKTKATYSTSGGRAIKKLDDPEDIKNDPSLWDKFISWWVENSSTYVPPSRGGGSYRATQKENDLVDFKATENKFGRFTEYQNAVKAEDMLPKPDIAANVDPSQYIVYDRNMGSMMMKSGNRTPVDYIRGDVIPVTSNHTPTISARINDPDSPMFVPRFGSDIGTLQRGYFTNYNDVVQVLEERNASYFMSKAQKDRMDLKANSGMA